MVHVKSSLCRMFLVTAGVVALGGAAGASTIVGGGLAGSIACPDGSSPCSTSADFTLDPPTPVKPAIGSITISGGTATISLSVASYTMTGSSGSVTALDFTNVLYSAVVPVSVLPLGGGFESITQVAPALDGTVQGTYAQVGGPGATPFSDLSVSFSDLNCVLQNGQGQCGFNVGTFAVSADLGLDVDGLPHDLVQNFNVVVPEPGSFSMLALGLLGLAARRR